MNPRSWAEVGWGPRREVDSAVEQLKANTEVKLKNMARQLASGMFLN